MGFEYALAAALGLAFGGISGALAGYLMLRNAGPIVTARALSEFERVRADWVAWRQGAEAVLEGMSELEEVIERKRRRVAARESAEKPKATNGADGREAVIARARALGHPV